MNKFNLYVWVGLILSASILGALLYMLQTGEMSLEGPAGSANPELMKTLMIIACVSFPLQIVSMMVLNYKPTFAIVLAIISSIALMPITIVFAMGMIFSAIRWRYHQLTPFDTTINVPFDINIPMNKRNNTIMVFSIAILGIVLIVLSQSLGMFLFVFAVFLGFFGKKASSSTYLAIKDNHFYIRPNIFAYCYRIPLSDVFYVKSEKGKLFFTAKVEDSSIQLSATPVNMAHEDQAKIEKLLSRIKK
ncbi:TPA: hypothetical protein ACS8BP_002168 [Providencia alcalifaciens]|uniref:hypothetical protein n=1 Tax=Providencia alcalifaciens TaxID=126385 RepID=UPI00029C27D2|nr:hypothetical protein [Providencia alcalifaciens]EKT65702.1 hypothetical protein OO9_09578 [Providencia alcalifaciens Dmel2]HEF8783905.1 hypothetical protein [Providencia alcalifaciens]